LTDGWLRINALELGHKREGKENEMTTTLCIKHNNCGVKEMCPLCRNEFRAMVGFVLWVDGTGELVCDECAGKEDPHLLAACRDLAKRDTFRDTVADIADEIPFSRLSALFAALYELTRPEDGSLPDGDRAARWELGIMYGGANP
jgi:hypothetical protein